MTTEELNTQLYEKMFAEQEKYRQWLLTQPPDEILNHAYEYTIRNDILLSLEYSDLTGKQAQALLKSPCPLDDVFKAWEKQETGHMQDIFNTMEARANAVLREEFKKAQREAR